MTIEETTTAFNSATLRRRLKQDERKNAHKRRFERHATFMLAQMVMMNTSQRFEGVVNEVSLGGMRFRPASRYLQRRDTETVTVAVGGRTFSGRIRSSRPDGYGIELLEPLTDEDLQDLLAAQEAY